MHNLLLVKNLVSIEIGLLVLFASLGIAALLCQQGIILAISFTWLGLPLYALSWVKNLSPKNSLFIVASITILSALIICNFIIGASCCAMVGLITLFPQVSPVLLGILNLGLMSSIGTYVITLIPEDTQLAEDFPQQWSNINFEIVLCTIILGTISIAAYYQYYLHYF